MLLYSYGYWFVPHLPSVITEVSLICLQRQRMKKVKSGLSVNMITCLTTTPSFTNTDSPKLSYSTLIKKVRRQMSRFVTAGIMNYSSVRELFVIWVKCLWQSPTSLSCHHAHKRRWLTNLQGINLVLDLLDAVFGGHQLSFFGGDSFSNLLGFLLVLLQVAQLHLTLFDSLTLLETQLTHRLQSFDVPGRGTKGKFNQM